MRYDITGYLLKTWFTTIIIAPVILTSKLILGKDISDFIELYFISVIMGALFSVPIVIILYLSAKTINKLIPANWLFKIILIVLTLPLICLEFYMIGGTISITMAWIYAGIVIVCMLVYKINIIEGAESHHIPDPLFGDSE